MASYVEKYQYTDPKPFQVDYQGLLKGVAMKESYWKIGVQRVKNAHETASGLSLTGQTYKDKLNNFMTSADDQLKKALASDLSSYDNSAKAISIYSPLYKDKELMANHTRTEEYDKTLSDIENFRRKDGGKFYADANASYAYSGYKEFKDRMDQGESAVEYTSKNRAKEYIPYYDYKKELDESIKNCPEQKSAYSAMNNANGAYLDNSTMSFKTVAGLRNCAGSMLSEKARTQMMIEGSVMFEGRERDLAETYLSYHNTETVKANNDMMVQIDLQISKSKNSDEIQQLQNQKVILANENKEVQEYMDMYKKGDLSFVTGDNFERIATAAYSSAKLKEIGQAYALEKVDLDVSANPIFMLAKKQAHDELMANLNFRYQSKLNTQKFNQDVVLEGIKGKVGSSASQVDLEKQYMKDLGEGKLSVVKKNGDGSYSYKSEEEFLGEKQTTAAKPSTDNVLTSIVGAQQEIEGLDQQQKQLFKNYTSELKNNRDFDENTNPQTMLAHANTVINMYKNSNNPDEIRQVEAAKELKTQLNDILDKKRRNSFLLEGTKEASKELKFFTKNDLTYHPTSNGKYDIITIDASSNPITGMFNDNRHTLMTEQQTLDFYNHKPVKLSNGDIYQLSRTDDASLVDNYINVSITDASGESKNRKIEVAGMNTSNGTGGMFARAAQNLWEANNKVVDKFIGANAVKVQGWVKSSTYNNLSGKQKEQVNTVITGAYKNIGNDVYKTLESFRDNLNFYSDFRSGTVNIVFPEDPGTMTLKYGNDLVGNVFKMKADGFYNPIAEMNYDFDEQIKNQIPLLTRPNAKNELMLYQSGYIIRGTPIGASGPTPDGNSYKYTIYENDGSNDFKSAPIMSGNRKLTYAEMKARILEFKQ